MHRTSGGLKFSPTDLVNHLDCVHLTGLNRELADGRIKRPPYRDQTAEFVAQHGELHEQRYLNRLKAEGIEVVEIAEDAVEETIAAMTRGSAVIYQAAFDHDGWAGFADFLVRVDQPSELGSYSYEVHDTKLSRSAKATALVQLAEYSDHVARIQGRFPDRVHLILGDNSVQTFALSQVAPYHRAVRERFKREVPTDLLSAYPEPVEQCSRCAWHSRCRQRRIDDDHLTLVADLGRTQAAALETSGISRLADLAVAPDDLKPKRMAQETFDRLRNQARIQWEGRTHGPIYELLDPSGSVLGLEQLPQPSAADIFFDIESDPFFGAGGLEYLFGFVDAASNYVDLWAYDSADEMRLFQAFIDDVMDRRSRDPTMHVYHYGIYESTALKRLACRHATREIELDHLLRNSVFVDLHRIVKRSLRASVESYSIKRLEPFYGRTRQTEVSSGIESAVVFDAFLAAENPDDRSELDKIAAYNLDDCDSTRELRGWLEGLRSEAERRHGRRLGRPDMSLVEASEAAGDAEARVAALQSRLFRNLPENPALFDTDQKARYTLGHLLQWHQREARPEWWAYFNRLAMTDEELLDDNECIGGIEFISSHDGPRNTRYHTYQFDPQQELKLDGDDTLIDPATEKGVTVRELDTHTGRLVISRSGTNDAPHPLSLIAAGPISTTVQRESLQELAQDWINGDDDRVQLAQRLLRHEPPQPMAHHVAGAANHVAAATQIAIELDGDFLAIQGPPGSGKTYTGAALIGSLVGKGQRVGITANSHKVINNLLSAVVAEYPDLRALKKTVSGETLPPGVEGEDKYPKVVESLDERGVDVLAGTTWAMSRRDLAGKLDTLVIDEAGQMSLANVLAASRVARNLVLLGDPQQLSQPTKASHPPGTNESALSYLLRGAETMPDGLGLFLPESRRMHPDVCRFISEQFYGDRLDSLDVCGEQRFGSIPTGIHVRFVDHEARRGAAPEEATVVAHIAESLQGETWIDQAGRTRQLAEQDILVVTPYNAQIRELQRTLGDQYRIGTVDLFQGQEAPVVIYSLAVSTVELAPRGLDFLFDLNRLNVAVSRAQGAVFVVCSPRLLPPSCKTPEQVAMASAMCRLVELSHPRGVDSQ